jgi:hypothetical protein
MQHMVHHFVVPEALNQSASGVPVHPLLLHTAPYMHGKELLYQILQEHDCRHHII